MPYFLTYEEYDPGGLYETDAPLELVTEWCEIMDIDLRAYFTGIEYYRKEDLIWLSDKPNALNPTAENMKSDIERMTAHKAQKAAAREAYLASLSPEERYREENTLHMQSLDHLMHVAHFPPRT